MQKEKELRALFQKSDTSVIIDRTKKCETQIQIQRCQHTEPVRKSRWRILIHQICYMDKTVFLIHLMVCAGVFLWGHGAQWERISMIAAGALGALSLLEVGNMFFQGTTELAESCYFNASQLAAFQMAYSGLLSLAVLLATTVYSGLKGQLDILNTGIYTLVPFVFTECVCLTVLLMEAGRRSLLLLVAAGVFSALFWGVLTLVPRLYEASALAFWGAALAAGTGILMIQLRRFFSALDRGELLCAD